MTAAPKRGALKSTCAVCAKVFTVSPSKAARGGGVTCSAACRKDIAGFGRLVRAALPGTARQVADRSGVMLASLRAMLTKMLRAGTCHVAGFERNDQGKLQGAPKFMPVLALGPSPDPDMPADMRAAVTYHTRKITLAAMPNSVPAIAVDTGMPQTSTLRIVKQLHDEGLCRVGDWQRSIRGLPSAIYHAGAGEDVPCRLKKFTPAQKTARYLRNVKNNPDLGVKRDLTVARDRNRYWEKVATERRDPMIAALFGPARAPMESS
jgi:hypothetical protein